MPEKIALPPARDVNRNLTEPVTFQERYAPPLNDEIVCESSTAPVAGSTTSIRWTLPADVQSTM